MSVFKSKKGSTAKRSQKSESRLGHANGIELAKQELGDLINTGLSSIQSSNEIINILLDKVEDVWRQEELNAA